LTAVPTTSNTGNPNDDDPSGTVTSRVDFLAVGGTVYYIAVDSADGAPPGSVVLSWHPSPNSGTFKWASGVQSGTVLFENGPFPQTPSKGVSSAGNWPFNSTYLAAQGDGQRQLTVTRTGGFNGRVYVDVAVSSTVYTNTFQTNFFGTNIFTATFLTTNGSGGNFVPTTNDAIVSFTNLFLTNMFFTNSYQDNLYGNIVNDEDIGGEVTTLTITGLSLTNKPVFTTNSTLTNLLCANVFANPRCNNTLFPAATNGPDTNGIYTVTITNVFCNFDNPIVTNQYVDSVVGGEVNPDGPLNYPGGAAALQFDDYQMSVTATLSLADAAPNGPDCTAAGCLHRGVNPTFLLSILDAQLDPLESADLVPPVVDPLDGNASLNLLDLRVATPTACESNVVFNFQHANYYVQEANPNASMPTIRVVRGGTSSGAASVSYRMNWTINGNNTYHTYPLEAGSDYAKPNIDTSVSITGTLSWGDGDAGAKDIPVPTDFIVNDNLVEFNEDIRLQLFNPTPVSPATPNAILGNVRETTLTITADNARGGEQPAGAADNNYSVDFWSDAYPSFNPIPGANASVYGVAVQGDDKVVIVGDFSAFDTVPWNRIARMDINGLPDFTFDPGDGANDFITSTAIDGTGRIVIGGGFTSFNGTTRFHVARLGQTGSLDTSFKPGFGANGTVWATVLQSDGKILIGGEFTAYDATNRNAIARLNTDGSLDATFNPSSGANDTVFAAATQTDGKIVIGGQFTMVNGVPRSHIARLNADGSLDASFNPGVGTSDNVYAIAVQSDGKIILGGAFNTYNLTDQNGITRVNSDGSIDSSFDIGTGADSTVYALQLQPDGSILVGGRFKYFNETRRVGVARLLPSGWVDTGFMDTAYNQFAGLANHYYNEFVYNTNDLWSPNNARNFVFGIGLQSSGGVMIGGGFQRVGGGYTRSDMLDRYNVARLIGGSTPGPGNIQLTKSTYTVDENSGVFGCYVNLVRTNGTLGAIAVNFTTNFLPPGPGAVSANDIVLDALTTLPVLYDTYWPAPFIIQPTDWGWMKSDGYYGASEATSPGPPTIIPIFFDTVDNSIVDGNRYGKFALFQPDGDQTFTLGGETIPLGVAFGRRNSQLEIIDNDYYAGSFGFSLANYNVSRGPANTTVTVTVLRTNGTTGSVGLNFATTPGTALNGIDYVNTNGVLTFGAGVTSRSFQVQIKGSTIVQPDRFFNVKLSFASNPGNYGVLDPNVFPTNSTVTIIDGNLPAGHLNFASASNSVGETAGFKAISVTRNGGSVGAVSVDFQTTPGTAVDGVNYVGTNGTLRWNSGDIQAKTFLVPVIHDGAVTGDLTVNLKLSNPVIASNPGDPNNTNVLGLVSNSVLTVVDEDAYGQIGFIAPNFNTTENAHTTHVTVSRTGGVAGSAVINYATTNLGPTNNPIFAQAFTNYVPTNGQLSFGPGELSKSFDVLLIDNGVQNPDKVFGVVLFNPSPSAITNQSITLATVTIIDDETQHAPAGQVDTTYVYPGFNDAVLATTLQPDGKLLAGGDFTLVNSSVRNRIARLNVDGSVDSDFGNSLTGVDGSVRAVLSLNPNPSLSMLTGYQNGPIVIAGAFDNVNGVFRHKIARLNLDGSLDSTFNPGSGADAPIYALAQVLAGTNQVRKVLAVGAFGSFNGAPANGIVRLNDNGTIDQAFNTGGVNGTNGTIYAIALQADGKILIGGDFTSFGGVTHNHLARLNPNGSVDNTFTAGSDASVRAITIQPDGKILIGGLFATVNGSAFNRVARLNVDGSIDAGFNLGVGANDSVLSLAVDSQGRILVGGEFTSASGVTRYRLTRLAADGTVDPSINFGAGADNYIASIAVQNDDKIIIAGGFSSFDNIPQGHVARLIGGSTRGGGQITFSSAQYVINENGTNAIITLRRIGGTDSTLSPASSIDFETQDGSAVAGIDYVGVTNTIIFPRGETFETVIVPVIDNNLVDGDRFVNLLLANPLNGLALGPQPYSTLLIINDDSGVSFDAALYRVAENTPSGAAVIPVIRSGSTVGTMSVDVATGGGSALEFVNYIPTTNTIVFNDGESTKLFRVQILNDGLVDGDQTVGLQLSNPQGGYLVSPNVATLTIAESSFGSGVLGFSQTNYSAFESSGVAAVTVVRTNGSTGPVSVTLATGDGTASAGPDYVATNVVVAFADGEISKTVYIRTVQHTSVQPDKTFFVTLSNPQGGATIGVNPAMITILDDHMNFSFSSSAYFVRQDAGTVIVTVLRNSGTNGFVTVNYSTTNAVPTNGVAVAGEDYTTTSGTLTFAPGEVSKSIFIPIIDDGQIGSDEQFSVYLSDPGPNTYLGSPNIAVVSILNGHSGLGFSSATYTIAEGQSNAVITVNRTAINTGIITVGFSTTDGSARAGLRYVTTNGVLTFANGQASASFTVPIIDNNIVDGDQTVLLNLFNPSTGVSLVNSNAVLTIQDNDAGLRFSSINYRVLKSGVSATITVLRTTVTNFPVTVDFATKDGTATAPVNYNSTNGTLSFLAGETSKTFDVVIKDNNIITGDKTVLLNLSNPSTNGVLISPLSATLTIVEDNGSLVVPAGVALLSESGPVNGLIDSGETVSLYFAFRNTGGGDTTNLVATLLNTNGVTNATAATPYSGVGNSASYGRLIENGPSVSQRFSLKANATNGQTITATFVLEDVVGAARRQLGNGVFSFPIGSQTYSFTNSAFIQINDSTNPPTKASPYPSQINVSGVIGTVAKVTTTMVGVSHTYPDDIDALLVGPNNQAGPAPNTLLMAAVGGPFSISNVRLTFDDSYPSLPNESPITTGTNRPTLGTAASEPFFYPSFPTNAPSGPFPVTMSVFNGINPNGLWSLYIVDSTYHDAGSVNNGWILNLITGAQLDQSADLSVNITGSPVPATVSNLVDYHITVTNYGPAGATNLVFTDVLPAGMTYLSNTISGTFNAASNIFSCTIGSLQKDGTGSFDIYVRTDVIGTFTNSISVNADQFDPDSANNTASILTEVDSAQADLAAAIAITPNPVLMNNNVTITMTAINNGFSPAIAVMLTNQLPVGLSLQSVSSSLGSAVITTNASGLVVVALGDLPVNSNPITSPTVTITATATNAGTNLVSVRVASSTFDPLKGNNVASAKVEVDPPTLGASAAQNGLLLTWPATVGTNFVVEQTTSLAPPSAWTPVTDSSAVLVNGQYQIQVSSSNSARFFRLRAQ